MALVCTPSALLAAAKCFPCLTEKQLRAARTQLLCQYAFQQTCTKPTSPDNAGTSSTTQTTITITWTEGASPLAPVTGFRIIWGTSLHSNNLGDVTVAATPLSYTITGLSPSQTVFFEIFALSNGCQSAFSTGSSATTSTSACAAGTAFATAWAARVVVNGGTNPTAAEQLAVANFQCGLITDGLDTSMLEWNAFVSSSLIGAITPQLFLAGFNDPWTNNNFVVGDLTVAGLIGNGANKFLDTGIDTSDPTFWGPNFPNNCGITIYLETNPNGVQAVVTGNSAGGASLLALEIFGGNTQIIMWDVASDIVAPNAGFTGYISVNRTAINSLAIYEANSVTPHNTLATSAVNNGGTVTPNGFRLPVFCYRDNTGTQLFEYKRLGLIMLHKGLSSAQSALLFARVQTFMTALGRQI